MISPWLLLTANSVLVSWDAPEECISLEALRTQVEAEYSWDDAKVRRQLKGRVAPQRPGWVVTLQVYEDGKYLGDRVLELDESDCRAHDETITLVSALLLEHGPAPLAEPVPPPEPQPEEKPAEDPPESNAPFFRGRALAAISAAFSWTPQPSYGPSMALGLGIGRYFWLDLTGAYLAARESQIEDATFRAQAGRAGIRACGELSGERWFTDLCLAGGWIGLRATGLSAEENRSPFFSTAELGADWLGGIHLNRSWSLFGQVSLGFPLHKGRFVLLDNEQERELFSTNRVLPTLNVGIRLTF